MDKLTTYSALKHVDGSKLRSSISSENVLIPLISFQKEGKPNRDLKARSVTVWMRQVMQFVLRLNPSSSVHQPVALSNNFSVHVAFNPMLKFNKAAQPVLLRTEKMATRLKNHNKDLYDFGSGMRSKLKTLHAVKRLNKHVTEVSRTSNKKIEQVVAPVTRQLVKQVVHETRIEESAVINNASSRSNTSRSLNAGVYPQSLHPKVAPLELGHLTDQVIKTIDERILAHKQRMGRI